MSGVTPSGHPPGEAAHRPIVTLTTDFGSADFYAAAMKAVLIRHCPDVRLVDVTHHVPRHDILRGSICLERAVDAFPPGTVHLAVVDPGVGSSRKLLVVRIQSQTVVCPDNGLITWAWRRMGPGVARELTWRPGQSSTTFHGRDILAPVAARIASGEPVDLFAGGEIDPVLLPVWPVTAPPVKGHVIHIDHYGNATTNIVRDLMGHAGQTVRTTRADVGKLRGSYSDVELGEALAIIGSSGLVEIAVREGSAAEALALKVGDDVWVESTGATG